MQHDIFGQPVFQVFGLKCVAQAPLKLYSNFGRDDLYDFYMAILGPSWPISDGIKVDQQSGNVATGFLNRKGGLSGVYRPEIPRWVGSANWLGMAKTITPARC